MYHDRLQYQTLERGNTVTVGSSQMFATKAKYSALCTPAIDTAFIDSEVITERLSTQLTLNDWLRTFGLAKNI